MSEPDEWRGVDFPRDRTINLRLEFEVSGYWDVGMQCWVLCRPLHVEAVYRPRAWRPLRSDEGG